MSRQKSSVLAMLQNPLRLAHGCLSPSSDLISPHCVVRVEYSCIDGFSTSVDGEADWDYASAATSGSFTPSAQPPSRFIVRRNLLLRPTGQHILP